MNDNRRPNLSIARTHGHTDPPSESAEVLKADGSPTFYWELTGADYADAYPVALEDEGYLANDLLTGAKLLGTGEAYEPCPPVVRLPAPEIDTYVYSDAIAAILQVAAWNGQDVEEIAEAAVHRQQSTYEWSADAARGRPAPNRR